MTLRYTTVEFWVATFGVLVTWGVLAWDIPMVNEYAETTAGFIGMVLAWFGRTRPDNEES